jgi:hypothetical protein
MCVVDSAVWEVGENRPAALSEARTGWGDRERRRRIARGRGQLLPDRVGMLLHELLAEHLSSRPRSRWQDSLRDSVRDALPSLSLAHALALETRLVSLAARYLDRYLPARSSEFLGAEVFVEDVRLDLLWLESGRLFADELKTGSAPMSRAMAIRQSHAQLMAGRAAFGNAFAGVRVVLLALGEAVWVRR